MRKNKLFDEGMKLPPVKKGGPTTEDEVLKLIKRNQGIKGDQKASLEYKYNSQGQKTPQTGDIIDMGFNKNGQLNYDEIRKVAKENARKEDKNDLLSQYFSTKKSLNRIQ
mmetsp:Transcript_22099/g.21302  ORF Transcript_22099/g.21302 Transcript_22099/m.21302 type:complete len:110 (+) Transcript_22099:299-628(+)